jgi:hypothetical protein
MRWRANPFYAHKEPWDLGGAWGWAWRALLFAVLVAVLVWGSWIGAALFAVTWVVAEALQLRRTRNR